ncbi:signal peptidase II [bacterium]|nr:signal peptidase II [bacterium]
MKKSVKNINNFIYFAITLIILSFSDYYFATWIVKKLSRGFVFNIPLLNLVYAENTGAAFNILNDSNKFLANFAIIVIFVVFLYLVNNISNTNKKFLFLLSLFTAGIFGNLYERLTLGYVRDFFELTFIDFPIFNISDIFITISVIGFIIAILFSRKI